MTTAAIIIPCPDVDVGAQTARIAQEMAGIDCAAIVVSDYMLRGDSHPGCAAVAAARDLEVDYIAQLNDDLRPTQQGWLVRMIEALEERPEYGIAGPSGHCRTMPQGKGKAGMSPGIEVVRALAFFCAVVKRQVIEQHGWFDKAFHFWGNDSDLVRRAQAGGWKCIWVRDVFFEHELMGVTKRHPELTGLYEQWRGPDKALFKKRWPNG